MFYIGFYTTAEIEPKRSVSLAANSKMDYTIDVISECVDDLEVISAANSQRGETFSMGKRLKIRPNVILKLFPVVPAKNKLCQYINRILVNLSLFLYLIVRVSNKDIIIAYHSLITSSLVCLAKKIKGFKLILELNEIYSDVSSNRAIYRNKELQAISVADAYIFPNTLMNGLFNESHKPYLVEHGVYKANMNKIDRFNDGKIHIVYAGTFEMEKGGVITAINAGKFLPSNYHIHILGFGTKEEVDQVVSAISKAQEDADCIITYEGMLEGDDFQNFLKKCHIGLSTQIPGKKYNDTSFPSKILNYISNGLQVVSIAIPAVKQSELASCLFLYNENKPEEIANAILKIHEFNPNYNLLNSLDLKLRENFKALLNKLRNKL